jgi:hypothetical protein
MPVGDPLLYPFDIFMYFFIVASEPSVKSLLGDLVVLYGILRIS